MEVVDRGVEEVAVKKKEVERGNKVLVTPLYGVKGAWREGARGWTEDGWMRADSRDARRARGTAD